MLPLTKKSPFFKLPFVTSTVDTGPFPWSIRDSKITPMALTSKSAFRSRRSDWRIIFFLSLSKFFLVLAEISANKVSPLNSSAMSSYSKSWFFTFWGSALGKSHLLIATIIGTFAAFECFMASIVWGLTPSSAATTKITMSVTFDPLALISVKAACPGVSINVIFFPSSVIIL